MLVFNHLMDNKSITNLTAFEKWRCTRLGDVIHQLRKKGVPIETTMVKIDNKPGFARYSLSRGFIVDYNHQLKKDLTAA